MIGKVWHAHILNTQMYFHHMPFCSRNREETEKIADDLLMFEKLKALSIAHMNKTV